jgi:hypothetical protein
VHRAADDTVSFRDLRVDLARLVLTALLTLLILDVAGWPDGSSAVWLGLLAAAGAFAIVMVAEFGLNLLLAEGRLAQDELARIRPELQHPRAEHGELEALRHHADQMREVFQEQTASDKRAIAIIEAQSKVLWGVINEQNKGTTVPITAIMARLEASTSIVTQDFGATKP